MAQAEALIEAGPRRLADMAKAGITLQLLSAGGPGADLLDEVEGSPLRRRIQRPPATDHKRSKPDRFAGFAHLPMSAPDAAADELERAVTDLGLKGAMVNGTTRGLFLDDLRFDPLLARAERLGVPLYIHPEPATRMRCGTLTTAASRRTPGCCCQARASAGMPRRPCISFA